ncbi:MAG: lipopolysaccharide heptosyltransferase II [Magnetococcales bacterium]|nr:lipopolysaccharide heptosyltransferase II [Magnetococcales bacterium]
MERTGLLIVAPAWIGDMVMTHALIRWLHQQQPDEAIDLLAPEWSAPLTQAMPEVRHTIPIPIGHGQLALTSRYRLGRQLRDHRYRQAIVLPNSFKSALIPFWATIPQRIGYVGEWRWGLLTEARKLDRRRWPRMVDRLVALGCPSGSPLPHPLPLPLLQVDATAAAEVARQQRLSPDRPLAILCPGAAYGPAKRWPLSHYGEVARHLTATGWQVVILGSQQEKPDGEQIQTMSHHSVHNLAGQLSLAQSIALLSRADLVISNDSGLMHVAAALQRRLIALFGSSDPYHTPPLSDQATILYRQLACSPCLRRDCRYGTLHCLTEIRPETIITLLHDPVYGIVSVH